MKNRQRKYLYIFITVLVGIAAYYWITSYCRDVTLSRLSSESFSDYPELAKLVTKLQHASYPDRPDVLIKYYPKVMSQEEKPSPEFQKELVKILRACLREKRNQIIDTVSNSKEAWNSSNPIEWGVSEFMDTYDEMNDCSPGFILYESIFSLLEDIDPKYASAAIPEIMVIAKDETLPCSLRALALSLIVRIGNPAPLNEIKEIIKQSEPVVQISFHFRDLLFKEDGGMMYMYKTFTGDSVRTLFADDDKLSLVFNNRFITEKYSEKGALFYAAATALAVLSSDDDLSTLMDSTNSRIRAAAILGSGKRGYYIDISDDYRKSTEKHLLHIMSNGNTPFEKIVAGLALHSIYRSLDISMELNSILHSTSDPALKVVIVYVLSYSLEKSAEVLLKLLEDKNENDIVRQAAAYAFIRNPVDNLDSTLSISDHLINVALDKENPIILRNAAILGAAKFHNKKTEQQVLQILTEHVQRCSQNTPSGQSILLGETFSKVIETIKSPECFQFLQKLSKSKRQFSEKRDIAAALRKYNQHAPQNSDSSER